MAVPWSTVRAAIAEHKGIEVQPRRDGIFLRFKFKRHTLRILPGPTAEYKIGEIRHMVSQLKVDHRDIFEKHIPEL